MVATSSIGILGTTSQDSSWAYRQFLKAERVDGAIRSIHGGIKGCLNNQDDSHNYGLHPTILESPIDVLVAVTLASVYVRCKNMLILKYQLWFFYCHYVHLLFKPPGQRMRVQTIRWTSNIKEKWWSQVDQKHFLGSGVDGEQLQQFTFWKMDVSFVNGQVPER